MNEDVMKIFAKAKIVNGKIENVNPIEFGWAIEKMLQENKELRIQISARETVVDELEKENKELKKQLNDIHSNFCKFNWKESNNRQVYNQLKELYESIYRKGNK